MIISENVKNVNSMNSMNSMNGARGIGFPSRAIVERIRKEYPAGTHVELVYMDDISAPPAGTIGEVVGVDDVGSLLVRWSNNSSLSVAYGVDIVRKI